MQKRNRHPAPLPDFAPVPRKCARHDGWTDERQRDFIEALADTGSVKAACQRVGMSIVGAYFLRRQPGAEEFAAAWNAALDHGIRQLEDLLLERAIHGIEVPVYSYGKLVGTRRVFNDRLAMFMLRNRAADRFSAGASGKRLNQVDPDMESGESALARMQAHMDLVHERLMEAEGEEEQAFRLWCEERERDAGLEGEGKVEG